MKNSEEIKVGYLVAYDYEYLKYSLPTIYEYADKIVLAIDKNRKTWIGQSFDISTEFFTWLKDFDRENKISIYEEELAVLGLGSMESEVRARNLLAQYLGEGGWHLQIDVDEYFIDFKGFVDYLRSLEYNKIPLSIYAKWITIFKQEGEDFFLIDSNELFPLASNKPQYTLGRAQSSEVKSIHTNFYVLHQSWGRSYEEMQQKLSNWSHKDDFLTFENDSYFSLWKSIDKHNYKYIKNFHPLFNTDWKELTYINAQNIYSLVDKVKMELEDKKEEDNCHQSFWKKLFSKKKK